MAESTLTKAPIERVVQNLEEVLRMLAWPVRRRAARLILAAVYIAAGKDEDRRFGVSVETSRIIREFPDLGLTGRDKDYFTLELSKLAMGACLDTPGMAEAMEEMLLRVAGEDYPSGQKTLLGYLMEKLGNDRVKDAVSYNSGMISGESLEAFESNLLVMSVLTRTDDVIILGREDLSNDQVVNLVKEYYESKGYTVAPGGHEFHFIFDKDGVSGDVLISPTEYAVMISADDQI